MYYTVFGWPAGAQSYQVSRYDMRTRERLILDEALRRNQYGYETPERAPCLIQVYPQLKGDLQGRPYTFPVNNPPSLAALRWMCRTALNDVEVEDGVDLKFPDNPKWPDSELNAYVREAIGLFNTYLPKTRTITTALNRITRADLGLSPDDRVKGVAYESSRAARSGQLMTMPRNARRLRQQVQPMWDIERGELTLFFMDPRTMSLEVTVEGHYLVPIDDSEVIDLPQEHWDIISIYVQGKAYLRLAGQSAQLDRWKEEGIRSDNPITPIARRLLGDAMDRITALKGPVGMRRVQR